MERSLGRMSQWYPMGMKSMSGPGQKALYSSGRIGIPGGARYILIIQDWFPQDMEGRHERDK